MLTSIEATRIVKACIRRVSGSSSKVQDKLREVGITTPNRLNALIGFIVDDRKIGVRSKNHRISPNAFSGLSINNTVGDTRAVVRDKAVEIGQ